VNLSSPGEEVKTGIAAREQELRAITDKLLEPRPGSVRAQLDELPNFAVSRLTELRKLPAHPESVNEAHSLLTAPVGRITLWPVAEGVDFGAVSEQQSPNRR